MQEVVLESDAVMQEYLDIRHAGNWTRLEICISPSLSLRQRLLRSSDYQSPSWSSVECQVLVKLLCHVKKIFL